MKTYLGIDNGVSGTLGIIYPNGEWHYKKTPTKKELSYTKQKQYVKRIDFDKLYKLLSIAKRKSHKNILVLLERPLVNAKQFKTTQSAMRSLEATLIAVESLRLPYRYIDSKEWQSALLPKKKSKKKKLKTDKEKKKNRSENRAELKRMSLEIGKRLYPGSDGVNGEDADGLLIAHYAKIKKL